MLRIAIAGASGRMGRMLIDAFHPTIRLENTSVTNAT
jgi:dihydrodipicolinate reductase